MMPPIEVPVFCRGVHDDRGAVLQRLTQHWTGGVVHDQRNAQLASDFCDLGDRKYREFRIGQRLTVIAAGLLVGREPEILRVGRIDEPALDPHRLHGVREQIPCAAIDVGRADEIVAGMTDVLDGSQ